MKKLFVLFVTLFSVIAIQAQNNLEYVQTSDWETARIRPNLYYEFLPFGISGFTFFEAYMKSMEVDEGGTAKFYGETYLTKNFGGKLSWLGVRADVYHSDFFKNYAGLGFHIQPIDNDDVFLEFKYVPWHMQFVGTETVEHFGMAGFFLSWNFTLPVLKDVTLWTYQNINVHAEGGPQWYYGEAYLYKSIGNYAIGAGADFRPPTSGEGLWPSVNWGVILQYTFSK
jgi:hypothetical protein